MNLKRNSFYVRTLLWAWRLKPEDLTDCWLFWGTLLLPTFFVGRKKFWYAIGGVTLPVFAILGIGVATSRFEAGDWALFGLNCFGISGALIGSAVCWYRLFKRHGPIGERQPDWFSTGELPTKWWHWTVLAFAIPYFVPIAIVVCCGALIGALRGAGLDELGPRISSSWSAFTQAAKVRKSGICRKINLV